MFLSFSGLLDITKATAAQLIAYRDHLEEKSAPATVNRKMASLRSLMKYLVSEGILEKNPAEGVKLPKPATKKPTQAFTDEEVKKVLDLPKSDRDQLILLLLFNCGLRSEEIRKLSKNDCFWGEKHSTIRFKGKGGKIREIPLNETVREKLKAHAETSDDLLFNMHASTLYRIIKKYAKRADINPDLSPHSCRATIITKQLEEGIEITEVMDFAGHSSITTTQGYWKRRRGLDHSPVYKVSFGG